MQDADKEEEIKKNVALLTRITEEHIRKYPEQWWWLHRRWKKAKKPPLESDTDRAAVDRLRLTRMCQQFLDTGIVM